ncbi:MAG: NAD-dependent isocitrate dehydrogenase [Desulfarculus sp.]|nr:NAD-dependent isocitrate dehydrogenase [Desulfarculus sp.]
MPAKPYQVAVIGGDGIGPEVVAAALQLLQATGVAFDFRAYPAGDDCLAATGVALPAETLQGALAADAVLFGAAGNTAADVILRLRAELGTFVNLRPAKAYAGVDCLRPATDMMIVRENTECIYAGHENVLTPEVTIATRVITVAASERIARFALDWAGRHGRSKVTAVHKANVLRKSDGLFLACCRRVAPEYPALKYEEALVDSVAMRMVLDPTQFQVIVTTNLFGDILSDLAAGLIGGLGLCPSANLGPAHALFEPVHGSAPDIAGQGLANPTAAILCGAMLLRHLGEERAAARVEKAMEQCLASRETTADLGGKLSTSEAAQAVIKRLG